MWELLFDAAVWNTARDVALGAFAALWMSSQGGPQAQAPPGNGGGRTLVIPAGADGSCHASLTVRGHTFRMLLDSGATGSTFSLVFGSNMAAALGFDPQSLSYDNSYSSANGDGSEARVTLPEARFSAPGSSDGWMLRNAPAVITKARQEEGLFGAALLHKLNFSTWGGYCRLSLPGSETRSATNDDEPAPPSPDRWRDDPGPVGRTTPDYTHCIGYYCTLPKDDEPSPASANSGSALAGVPEMQTRGWCSYVLANPAGTLPGTIAGCRQYMAANVPPAAPADTARERAGFCTGGPNMPAGGQWQRTAAACAALGGQIAYTDR
jgi:predicted aspartyl protease